MDKETEKILSSLKSQTTGIFIDSANLFYAQRRAGWKISWLKFYKFLSEYTKLKSVNYYVGTPQEKGKALENKKLTSKLSKIGYTVITKPLKKIFVARNKFVYKCNFDVEIALDVAEKIDNIDTVIISSGDSDFIAIKNYCRKMGKDFLVICFEKNMAWELKYVHRIYFEKIKDQLSKKTPTLQSG
ncbi:hypothetical protein A2130_04170 [Candidatus Woesebacteria bacterium GWC2_33_12]|uniref:NYN domain-containing protein n=1 Tax=Candidatus Woesebacteria bacterium GW2011_GWB1_33_22 TaxID=1618566 RepID=A0A0F9ZIG7_9BACT|nr:MAG: hypothetical protein UR29_C0017G0007 [Candidatus Woesebacteria bacterium GW2011_GWC2_33_12]KKP41478.1 MAG: hypothetical protein UR33_C0015G0017 [Candidatus Woesebacteria bacterium GW2011_GWA2_33_20]KKP43894.1 MAG: hypothetical protein UR35_C0015G0017 [Candidatus Woesebacteria bacterium GW2011_GWB1_33_22]KKP45625.1 MAG: hypothetical protein UR37_C0017G0017 [Microgenomates group bacterium GW2011_GWC1_33_28]KKP49355.1 MAG: hypothetical protein UR41_C0016G0016 [Candidatus Woesebacteria bact